MTKFLKLYNLFINTKYIHNITSLTDGYTVHLLSKNYISGLGSPLLSIIETDRNCEQYKEIFVNIKHNEYKVVTKFLEENSA